MTMHVLFLIEMVWIHDKEATQIEEKNPLIFQMFLLDINEVTLTTNGDFCLILLLHLSPETKTLNTLYLSP